jgi:MYXO-CTERM domain-containing protein
LVLPIIGASGCLSSADSDAECELSPSRAKIERLEDRYALGSRATIDLRGEAPLTLASSNSEVVRIERVSNRVATLSFVGEGQATLVLENETSTTEQTVVVVPHDAFVVLLSEVIPIPIGELSDQVILAGHQHFLVLYLDSDGERLWGDGLADLTLSDRLRLCDEELGAFEFHCLDIEEAGPHVLEVSVGDERIVLPFQAVLERDIVEIALLQPDEEELAPGTWVQVDVVGVTEDGMHVASVHPWFEVEEARYVGYFAYQYDPEAPLQTLNVEALDRRLRTTFRGIPSEKTAFGCASSAPGDDGPVPAIVTLAGLMLFTKRRNRPAW